jgi:hypothetical protein
MKRFKTNLRRHKGTRQRPQEGDLFGMEIRFSTLNVW